MTVSNEFSAYACEVLSGLGPVTTRRMFGGAGVYHDGLMFGLIADDVLYLKADASTSPEYEAEGKGPFIYEGKGKPISMSYWEVPERLFDDPEEMTPWAVKAYKVALKASAKKK